MRAATEKRRRDKLAILCFTVALALLLTSLGATLAKYFRQESSAGVAVAARFFFTSDKLDGEDGAYYQIAEPAGDADAVIEFNLYNYVDALRCTKEAVQYTYWAVAGSDGDGEVIEGTQRASTGVFTAGVQSTEAVSLSVPQSAFGDDRVVTVFAQSSAPYAKTLRAQFGFDQREYTLQWSVEEDDAAVVLRFAGGDGGEVTVTWPTELYPDKSNPVLQGGDASDGAVTFQAEEGVRYAMTFLKPVPGQSYPKSLFSVTEASGG